eukprot:SAG22_NODE_643_length_8222_cov_5.448972_3_plen_343_part_00
MLMTAQEHGTCVASDLDGVAETDVPSADCTDMMDQCTLMVSAGMMSCDHDFCNTVPTAEAPCLMAGQCDQTCELCSGGGGHRRQLLAALAKLRQLQMSAIQCDPATFAESAEAADAACCDGSGCHDGVPSACDAKCAVVFNPFYGRCHRFLTAQFEPSEVANYDRLYTTCTTELPAEPLLQAIATCKMDFPTIIADRFCPDTMKIHSYSTHAEADTGCAANSTCGYVYDGGCNGEGTWYSCLYRPDAVEVSTGGSCLYTKSGLATGWAIIRDHYCHFTTTTQHEYGDRAAAAAACAADATCGYIYDSACDDQNSWKTCLSGSYHLDDSTGGSCVYELVTFDV